ncbi:protein-glutamate O-methyltransferase [Aeromonas sp. MR19]|jgi:chemotaxis protein methyltransferase CheR|uniref:protein-glutamate O-methyltransferase n=1 Tax=Aeromonas bestiarum TaxID=105751 RepID=A0AAP4JC33_9GAMM|nr:MULTISPECIES: protein-glutamate O-methyltransferase [Aeromonas]EKP0279027.1 protein-glutamate O-methyltransferase [Aeromonas bestiarum]KFN19363.1 chemotaxis protein CheR [Aeromonas bestiarum]MCH7376465.1 protein-glutamate O-methyltransferase [Aeromonas sp. MR19]MDM5071259.1 protein-glutamate O-methyltransferase [Aeromonas bestiarum]MDM5089010.1 protein-glutamate O-methyltransferase [Aeromonas bestiarum]
MKTLSDDLYKQFSNFLAVQSGIVLGDNKQYLVKSRLSPLMTQFGIESLSDLVTRAMSVRERDLKMAVVDAMTTNETLWFRDTYPFQLLTDKIFPELGKSGRPIKIWSAASSSGQEPYSIAMTALEQQVKKPGTLPGGVQIVGTDISSTMLNQCKEGVYDSLALARGLSPERKKLFFEAYGDNKMRVVERVRKLTTFRPLNLLESYSLLGKFDIIFCRNVLIYFAPEVKSKILNQFAASLNPGGYLMLGASESLAGLTDRFEMVRCNPGIVYKVK